MYFLPSLAKKKYILPLNLSAFQKLYINNLTKVFFFFLIYHYYYLFIYFTKYLHCVSLDRMCICYLRLSLHPGAKLGASASPARQRHTL